MKSLLRLVMPTQAHLIQTCMASQFLSNHLPCDDDDDDDSGDGD